MPILCRQTVKVFLDDERAAPAGWMLVHWPDDAIALLKTRLVVALSLDHDLGDDARGTGYDVLLWIEEAVVLSGFIPPVIYIHTANPAAKARMTAAVHSIIRYALQH